jgi:hypothetical protein
MGLFSGLLGSGHKKRMDDIMGSIDDASSYGRYTTPPYAPDPSEMAQEYDPRSAPSSAPQGHGGGILGGFVRGIQNGVNNGYFSAASATLHGDPATGFGIIHAAQQAEQQKREEEARQAEMAKMPDVLKGLGYDDGQIELLMSHPDVLHDVIADKFKKAPAVTRENGPDLVSYDPNEGSSKVVYHGKDDWQRYAEQFGEPGSPQYNAAVKDFVLRGGGPTGFGNQQQLIQQRQAGQQALRSMPTYSQAHAPAGGGGGHSAAAPRPTQTRVVGGKTYWKIRGLWYDNPEGR